MLIKAASIKAGDVIIPALGSSAIMIEDVSFLSVFKHDIVRCKTRDTTITFDLHSTVVRLDKYKIYFTGSQND